jgi:putative membrane protein
MHYYGNGGIGWGGWLVMVAMMVVFWGAIAWVIVTLIRHNGSLTHPASTGTDGMRILDERFARGEIDEAEYQRRRELLRGGT